MDKEYPKMFDDTLGRSWTVDITVGTLPRIKSIANVSIDDLVPRRVSKNDNGLLPLADFLSDVVSILQVTYAICKPQIDKAGLTFDQFAEGFEGDRSVDVCQAMGFAVLQAIHDFFLRGSPIPQPMRAAMVMRALAFGRKIATGEAKRGEVVMDRIEARLTKAMEEPITETELATMDRAMDEASKKFVGNMPGLSELTPAN